MRGILVFFGIILGLAIAAGYVVLISFMVLWNVTDIQNVGLNFWNVFWLVLVALSVLGSATGLAKN